MGGKCIDIGYLNGKNYLYIGDKNTRLDLLPFNTKILTNHESFVVKSSSRLSGRKRLVCMGNNPNVRGG